MNTEQASTEFDAWLAEHVMGWTHRPNGEDHECGDTLFLLTLSREGGSANCWKGTASVSERNGYEHRFTIWSPTTDIAHAWDLIERVLSLVHTEQDDPHGVNRVNRFYYALLQVSEGGVAFYQREKAALMICQAAYRAFQDNPNEENG